MEQTQRSAASFLFAPFFYSKQGNTNFFSLLGKFFSPTLKLFFPYIKSIFQALKYSSQSLEYSSQSLEYIFQALEHRNAVREKTFLIGGNNFCRGRKFNLLSMVVELLTCCGVSADLLR